MPKKSKKEKIRADLRRKAYTQQVLTTNIPTLVKEDLAPAYTIRIQQDKEHATVPATNTIELTAIKHDLYKTFLLAGIAILGEFALYWFGRGKL